MKITEVMSGLEKEGYIATKEIAYAVSGTIEADIPLMVEGDPGVGKTCLAKAVAGMLGLPLIRVQFYEGLTYDKILYDFDYQRQLLTIEAMRGMLDRELEGKSIEEAMDLTRKIDFYGKEFLIERPVLQALDGRQKSVLLLDEIDKASEEIEYTLLEVLDEYAITVPQLGTITCPKDKRPVIFLTSNRYRELSDALRRRCSYLYIERKTVEEIKKIILLQTGVSEKMAEGAARCMDRISKLPLKKMPSVSEAIDWVNYLKARGDDADPEEGLFLLAKSREDVQVIRGAGVFDPMR